MGVYVDSTYEPSSSIVASLASVSTNYQATPADHAPLIHIPPPLLRPRPLIIPHVLILLLPRIQLLELDVLAQDVPPDKVHKALHPPLGVHVRRHAEDLVQLLERQALCLGHEQENEPDADEVPAGIPGEGARRREGGVERGQGDGQHEVEEPRRRRRQRHAHRAHVQRVGFSGVGEGDGALPGAVDYAETVGRTVSEEDWKLGREPYR